jgi:hypothetical protein
MQFSADFVALGMHQADVLRAEREIRRRMSAEERGSGVAGASPEPVAHRRHRAQRRTPQLALR